MQQCVQGGGEVIARSSRMGIALPPCTGTYTVQNFREKGYLAREGPDAALS